MFYSLISYPWSSYFTFHFKKKTEVYVSWAILPKLLPPPSLLRQPPRALDTHVQLETASPAPVEPQVTPSTTIRLSR